MTLPKNMRIVHADQFRTDDFSDYDVTRYFRVCHDMQNLERCGNGCTTVIRADFPALAEQINESYTAQGIHVAPKDIDKWTAHPVYNPALWVCIKEQDIIVASGIAEFDPELREGILEWVQVSPTHRRRGLGRQIVLELLFRLKGAGAAFATVSGAIDNPTNPLGLYRARFFR